MAEHDLTQPEMTDTGDFLVMDDLGNTHDRPNDRRLVARSTDGGKMLLVEQMCYEEGWRDIGTVGLVQQASGGLEILSGPNATVRRD